MGSSSTAKTITVGQDANGLTTITVELAFGTTYSGMQQTMTYTIENSGAVTVSTTLNGSGLPNDGHNRFLRVGTDMILPAGFENVQWYGNGPVESMLDRKTFARVGVYTSTADKLYYPYMNGGDTGTLTDVNWITVSGDGKQTALAIAASTPIEAQALHYSASELSKDHPYKMFPSEKLYLSVNYASQGTGSATCGPDVLSQYTLPYNKPYSYSYTILPIMNTETASVMDATRAYRTATEAVTSETVIKDQSKNHFDVDLDAQANAQLIPDEELGTVMTGRFAVPANGYFDDKISGNNAFTIEAYIRPIDLARAKDAFNMIAGKGDHCAAFRFSEGGLYGFICNNEGNNGNGEWKFVSSLKMTDEEAKQLHHVAMTYSNADGGTLTIYLDGKTAKDTGVGTVKASAYELTIGQCPEQTKRIGYGQYNSFRVYSKALTVAELDQGDAAKRTDSSLELWYDFSTNARTAELRALVAACDASNRKDGDYSASSWSIYQGWLTTAKNLLSQEPIPADKQDAIDTTLARLNEAVAGLKADKAELQQLYTERANISEADGTKYTTESWTAFVLARRDAYEVLNKDDAKQPEINAAKTALQAALDGLTLKPSKDTLQDLVTANESKVDDTTYTEESRNALRTALDAAKEILKKAEPTEEELSKATSDLDAAIKGLTPAGQTVNKDALNAAIGEAKKLTEADYTAESWKPFADALKAAEDVLSKADATQDEVNAAVKALTDAKTALVKAEQPQPTVDKTALRNRYNELVITPNVGYTPESWANFQNALTYAESVLADDNATAEQVANALAALNNAANGLTQIAPPTPVIPVTPSEPAKNPFNPNAGSSVSKFPFADVPSDSWYYSSVKAAWENGLIDGVTVNEFKPNATLTVAQTIKLAAALHQLDRTGEVSLKNGGANWYDSYVNYAVTNGIIEKDYANYTKAQMNAPVTRGEFVHIFHGAEEAYKAINTVADNAIPDVNTTDKFAPEIYEFYRAGILTGSDAKGTFHSASTIKRSEAAAILLRMFEASARKSIILN